MKVTTDRFGQFVYVCPVCDRGFLTTLVTDEPDRVTSAWLFHARHQHFFRWLLAKVKAA